MDEVRLGSYDQNHGLPSGILQYPIGTVYGIFTNIYYIDPLQYIFMFKPNLNFYICLSYVDFIR